MKKAKQKEPKDFKDQEKRVMNRPKTYRIMSETEPSQAFERSPKQGQDKTL